MNRLSLLALAGALTLSACDSTEPEEIVDLEVQTAADVEADPSVSTGGGRPSYSGRYTLYDLDAGEIVLSSSETDAGVRQQDSTSTAWDIGFSGTTIIVNGGTSGPGAGSAQVLEAAFAEVTEAPASGYLADGENTCDNGSTTAVCGGSGASWYTYDPTTHLVTPIAGRTIALTTGDGDYAKVRVLSYYQGNPATPGGTSRYYTFEYVVQPDGSRDFETTTLD